MKKTTVIILLVLFSVSNIFAQRRGKSQVKWLNIELKGGYGGSILLNSDVASDKNATLAISQPAYEFGGRLGLTYGDYIGIGVELLKSGFNQDYDISVANSDTYTKTQKFKSSDIVITLKYTNLYGFYLELGPKFSTIKSVEVENSIQKSFIDITDSDYQKHFADKFTSIVFGLGFAAYNGDRLRINLGLRASYALGDIVEDENFYVLNDGFYRPDVSSTATTNPFNLKFMVGINYTFGFWGNASCGRGRFMLFQ